MTPLRQKRLWRGKGREGQWHFAKNISINIAESKTFLYLCSPN
jgi:hypothetical protein